MEQAVSDLPREDGRALALVEGNLAHDLGGGDAGLAAADGSGPDRPGFVVPAIIIICGTIRYTRQASKAVYAAVFVSTKFVRKEKGVWVREETSNISTNLPRILETQPLLTCSILEMSQGLAPE